MSTDNLAILLQKIDKRAEQLREEQVSFLAQLCNTDSGSCDLEGNARIVEYVDGMMNTFGAEVTKIESAGFGTHLIGRIAGKGPIDGRIVLHAHMDTVFKKGDAASHPFHIDGDYGWGLGAADCKGGVTTALYSARIIKELNIVPDHKEVIMMFNCDEEIGSPSARRDLFPKVMPDAEACISFEPGRAKNGILTARYGGLIANVRITGKSVHAGMDNGPGASAVVELANLVQYLHGLADEKLGIHYNAAPIKGGVGSTIVADYAEFDIFATYATKKAGSIVLETLENLPKAGVVDGCQIKVEIKENFPAMERNQEAVGLYERIRDVGKLLNMELPEELSRAAGDCNYLSAYGVPTVDGVGPYLFNIHTLDEHMIVHTLCDRTKLMSLFLASY